MRGLEARVAALETMVQEVREQLQQNSRTASRPPSSDPPQALGQRPRREPSGRRPGGQPGHEGQTRARLPVEAVDVIIPVKPERCPRCQHAWQGEDPRPQRHQVTEIPPSKPVVTEYLLHRVVCPACGAARRAELPASRAEDAAPGCRRSPRCAPGPITCPSALPSTAWRMYWACGWGWVQWQTWSKRRPRRWQPPWPRRGPRYRPSRRRMPTKPGGGQGDNGLGCGQSSRLGGPVFAVRLSRSGQGAQELLGARLWGWLVTDRWSGDSRYPPWRRQRCWAYRLRDIDAMIERGGRACAIGEVLRGQAHQMFHDWHRVRDGTLAPASFAHDRRPIRREVERLLDAGQTWGVPKTEGRDILKRRPAWWTFVRHAGVEPTNNAAERAIRPGVLWRKGSFGTHSPEGSQCVEAMMTVVATLKQQHRHGFDYLTAACEAALRGEPAPSLLPTPATLAQLTRPAA